MSSDNKEKISVALVDDHAIVRASIGKILSKDPDIAVIFEADDGEKMVHYLHGLASDKNLDVIVMDLAMPGFGGLEATKRLLRFIDQYPPNKWKKILYLKKNQN